jgi:hypothetical protein
MSSSQNSFIIVILALVLLSSCKAHKRSHIRANEEFIVELKKPATRGGAIDIALQGLFIGANYLAEKSAQSLTSSYSQDLFVNNYYNTDLGNVEKTYSEIHIKKYSQPESSQQKQNLENIIKYEVQPKQKSRGKSATFLAMDEIIRPENEDLLNFHAVIKLITDDENPGITRLSFEQLRVFFSKTKVFNDVDLNARVSILIKGKWRGEDGSPHSDILIEQEYDFKNLKYGAENQIQEPILSPWYYDIPIYPDVNGNSKFGIVEISVQLEEYEGNKSKYINQVPSILSKNKNSIIKNGSSTIKKITGN